MTGIFNLGNTQTFRGESIDSFAVEVDTLFNDLDTAVRFLRTESIRPMSGVHHSALAFLERQTYVTEFPRFENFKGADELTFRLEGVVDKIWEKIKGFFKWIYDKIADLFSSAEETPDVKPEEAKKVVEAVKQAVKAEESAGSSSASKQAVKAEESGGSSASKDEEISDEAIKKVKTAITKIRPMLRFSKNQDPVTDLELIKEAIENFKIISTNIIGLMNQEEISEDVVFNNTNSSKTQAEVDKKGNEKPEGKGVLLYAKFNKIQFLGVHSGSVEKKYYSLESEREDYEIVAMAKSLMEVGVNASLLAKDHKDAMNKVKTDVKAMESKISEKKADPKLGEKARLVMGVYVALMVTAENMIDTLNKCKSLVKIATS